MLAGAVSVVICMLMHFLSPGEIPWLLIFIMGITIDLLLRWKVSFKMAELAIYSHLGVAVSYEHRPGAMI